MRGKVVRGHRVRAQRRITPAHAGKSVLTFALNADKRDHPRPCGEKFGYEDNASAERGSPPPMRGKVNVIAAPDVLAGITPAHAGKRGLVYQTEYRIWDHPRPCGEKEGGASRPLTILGSPPPMRGKASGQS